MTELAYKKLRKKNFTFKFRKKFRKNNSMKFTKMTKNNLYLN